MKKILLLLSLAFITFTTASAVDIPKGTIYYDNSITNFESVKFVYGYDNATQGCKVVSMNKEENNVWSYEFLRSVRNVERYFFSGTTLPDGTYNQDFSTFKDYIVGRGEIRTATKEESFRNEYIFVPVDHIDKNWYQGNWILISDFKENEDNSNLPVANCNPNSGKLPVVYINTDGGKEITSKEEYLKGTIYIDAQGIPGYSDAGTSDAPLVTEVKGRGNYSWSGFDKKPYRIKLDKKTSLLNLTTDKSYNLLAHADDTNGFLRNTSGFAISRHFELDYTPTQEPVELFLNGEYKGLYFLVDHIKVSSNRVNITEQDDLETDSEAITGGWLLEIDNYSEDPHITIYKKDYYGSAMWFTYKSPEELSYDQEEYITNFLNLANDAIYSEDKYNTEWEKYIDMDALVNYYLTYEIVANREGFHGSCYLHKDRGEDTKLIFGPVWDFGSALINMNDTFIYDEYAWGVKWIDEIAKFPRFQTAVRERWMEKRGTLMPYLRKEVDAFIDKIVEAAQCDCDEWPSYGNRNVLNKKEEFYNSIERRLSWLDTQFGTVGVEEKDAIELSVYPNPTAGKIFVNTEEEILSATVYNLAGAVMLDLPINKKEWDLGLESGTYLLTVKTSNNTIVKKILVK
jgi:hypothetical protein